MNVGIIFAGGTGKRMNTKDKPKQFLELHGKPILVYTIEKFQNSSCIDAIILVSIDGWIPYCRELVEEYRLEKVVDIVKGGATGQSSIYAGLKRAHELFDGNSVVLIHDGVRPLIDDTTIENVVGCVLENGTAITVTPAIETITTNSIENKVGDIIDRTKCMLARAPQAFYLSDIYEAHEKSIKEGKEFIDSASLMRHYGFDLFTVVGPVENIKITTPMDYYVFSAMVSAKENDFFE